MSPTDASSTSHVLQTRAAQAPVNPERMRVMLVISSLEHGGAERQVLALAEHLDPDRFETHICSLSPHLHLSGSLPPRVPVHLVRKRWRFDPTVVTGLTRLLRQHRIDVVHSFLFDAEIATRLAGRIARVQAVVGSERNSNYVRSGPQSIANWLTRGLSHALVANSHAGKRFSMQTLGFPDSLVHVVYNGVDTARFYPRPAPLLRKQLGLPDNALVVGMVANFKRQKNYEMFLRVAERVLRSCPEAWFISAGAPMRDDQQGSERYHLDMRALATALGIDHRVRWLGTRDDMPQVYNLLDVAVLTSRREGTPNVLLEAMASGVPTVATEVADNAVHVQEGTTGFIVPLDDVETMAHRVLELLANSEARRVMGEAARQRAGRDYSLTRMAREMATTYEQILEHAKAARERVVLEHFRQASRSWGTRYTSPRRKISDQDLLLRRQNVHRLFEPIREASASSARLRVLDVGCGTGDVLDGVPRDRALVVGIDLVHDMVRRAAATHPQDAFVVASATTIPLADCSQDVVVCIGVLEYVPDPSAVLASIRRVLRPGGYLIVSFPNQQSAFRLLSRLESACVRVLFSVIHALGGRQRDDDRPGYRHTQWTAGGARRLLAAAGFQVDHIFFNTFGLWGHAGTWGPNLAFSEWMSRRWFAESPVSAWLATTMVARSVRTGPER